MKIKDVKHYLLNPGWGKNLLFVKVITDNGLEGWTIIVIPSLIGIKQLLSTSSTCQTI